MQINKIWKLRDESDPVTGKPISAPSPIVMPVVNGCVGPVPAELASSNLLASPSLSPASNAAASPPSSISISDASAAQGHPTSPAASGAGSAGPAAATAASPPTTPSAGRGSIQPHGTASAPESYPTHAFLTGHFVHVEADLKAGPDADGTYPVVSFTVPETMYLRISPPKGKAASTLERKSKEIAPVGDADGPASHLELAAALDPGSATLAVSGAGANQYGEFTLKGSLEVPTGRLVLTKKYGSAKARPRALKKRRSAVGDLTTGFSYNDGSDLEGSPTDSAGRRASNRKRHASWRLNETEFIEPSSLESEKARLQAAEKNAMSQRKRMQAVKRAAIKRAREEVAAAGGPVYEGGDTEDDDEDYDEMAPPRGKRSTGEGGRAGLRGSKPPTLTPAELAAQKKAQMAAAVAEAAASAFAHDKLVAKGRTYVAPHRLASEAGPLAGDLYEGELNGGRPHGQGTVIYRSGYMFEGRFENGLESGWGVLCDPMDVTVYEGEMAEGQLNGFGTFKFESGAMYAGQWRDGLFHGPGAYTQPDGSKFEGNWELGQLTGNGVAVYADGSMYTGSWVAGKKVGKGQLLRPNGYSYTGSWAEDVPEGKGEATYPDGSTYEGSFRAGKREGRGVYTFGSGNAVLSGRWKDDSLEDSGKGGLDIKQPLQVSEDQWLIPLTLATADVKRIHQRAGFNAGGE